MSKTPKPHKTETVGLKEAEIDIKIIPVIQWLNEFENVYTTHCCEGGEPPNEKPYVVFMCNDFFDLMKIVRDTRNYANCEIFWLEDYMPLRYNLQFAHKKTLKDFIDNYLDDYREII